MLNYAPCHEGVWVLGGNAPLFNLQHIVEVVGQLHALAT